MSCGGWEKKSFARFGSVHFFFPLCLPACVWMYWCASFWTGFFFFVIHSLRQPPQQNETKFSNELLLSNTVFMVRRPHFLSFYCRLARTQFFFVAVSCVQYATKYIFHLEMCIKFAHKVPQTAHYIEREKSIVRPIGGGDGLHWISMPTRMQAKEKIGPIESRFKSNKSDLWLRIVICNRHRCT